MTSSEESLQDLDARLAAAAKRAEEAERVRAPKPMRRAAHEERMLLLKTIQRVHPTHRAGDVAGGIKQLQERLDTDQY